MGIREQLNDNPQFVTCATVALIVFCLGYIGFQVYSEHNPPPPPNKAFYTTDDGVTFFADNAERITPFDKDGKQAVKAYVFTSDKGKTRFVGYLERYSDAARAEYKKQAEATHNQIDPIFLGNLASYGLEYKKPRTGPGGWVSMHDPDAAGITAQVAADGAGEVEMVLP